MRGGEQVIPARESLRLLTSDRERPSINAPISIRIEGNASPQTVQQIYNAAEDLKEAVLSIIQEEQEDERRRRYIQ